MRRMNPARTAATSMGYKNFEPSFRRTKTEPVGDRTRSNPTFQGETNDRPFTSSRGMHGSTWDAKMHSYGRELAADPDHEDLRKALRKNSSLRDTLYGKRLELKEKRNELRQERVLLADADGNFMKNSVRRFPEQDQFEVESEHYDQLEHQRDLVGSLQYEYDQAEEEYDFAENELDSEEGNLQVLLSKYMNKHCDTGDEPTSTPSLNSHLQPEEPQYCNEEDEARMCLAEYQSRIGDARIMEERLQDLLSEQEERDTFAKKRQHLGIDLEGSDDDFTENFNYRYSEIVGELDTIYADIERLKDGLIQAGYIFPKPNPNDRPPDVLAYQAHSRPRPAYFPVERERPLSENILQTLQNNFATNRAHISRWILNTFGSSPVECARHREILRGLIDGSLEDKEWARLVFEHWKRAECGGDDDSSRGSWDEILPRELMENTPQNSATLIRTPVLLSGKSEATHAMNGFSQQFPLYTPGGHAKPYATDVELDKLSEYESRSI